MIFVSEKKSYFQNYFGDSKFRMEVDLVETIQKSYILHVRTLKTELGKAPKASARGQCSLVTPLRCALLSEKNLDRILAFYERFRGLNTVLAKK